MEVGIDIVEIKRFNKLVLNQTFLNRVFTKNEQEILKTFKFSSSKAAGMFCVKEAFLKALGTGINGTILLNEIEISYLTGGKPILNLLNKKTEVLKNLGFTEIKISISHTNKLATAICVLN